MQAKYDISSVVLYSLVSMAGPTKSDSHCSEYVAVTRMSRKLLVQSAWYVSIDDHPCSTLCRPFNLLQLATETTGDCTSKSSYPISPISYYEHVPCYSLQLRTNQLHNLRSSHFIEYCFFCVRNSIKTDIRIMIMIASHSKRGSPDTQLTSISRCCHTSNYFAV